LTRPWVFPGGRPGTWPARKRAKGVFGHKLNEVWEDNVSPKVVSFLSEEGVDWSSVEVARFVSYEDIYELKGPVVIWIGVRPIHAEEQGDQIHRSTERILMLLKDLDIHDVTVEYRLPTYFSSDEGIDLTVRKLRTPLTHALGLFISASDMSAVEGTMALYMEMGEEMLGLTCRHVLFERDSNTNQEYSIDPSTSSHKNVQLLSTTAFTRLIKDIQSRIDSSRLSRRLDLETIQELEDEQLGRRPRRNAIDSSNLIVEGSNCYFPKPKSPATIQDELVFYRKRVTEYENEIEVLTSFLEQVQKNYGTPEQRIIGRTIYSPKLEPNVDESGFIEDWALFKLNKDQFETQFRGNVIDLDAKLPMGDFLEKMFSYSQNQPHPEMKFEYPPHRLLPVGDIMSKELLLRHTMLDEHDEPCLLVIKSGSASEVTIGRATGSFALVRDEETGKVSKQWAIYNYDQYRGFHSSFSECGDSGSVVVDGKGRIGGMIVGGSGCCEESETDFDVFVTYVTPMYWIMDRIKAKFPDIKLFPVIPEDPIAWIRRRGEVL
ncbi:hypothetical protein CPC08DRAFT_712801, partial [Agrocybe pediades]